MGSRPRASWCTSRRRDALTGTWEVPDPLRKHARRHLVDHGEPVVGRDAPGALPRQRTGTAETAPAALGVFGGRACPASGPADVFAADQSYGQATGTQAQALGEGSQRKPSAHWAMARHAHAPSTHLLSPGQGMSGPQPGGLAMDEGSQSPSVTGSTRVSLSRQARRTFTFPERVLHSTTASWPPGVGCALRAGGTNAVVRRASAEQMNFFMVASRRPG